MDTKRLTSKDVLSSAVTFPNDAASIRLTRLVGLNDQISTLTFDLRLIFDPALVDRWAIRHYGIKPPIVEMAQDAVPLIIFEGDVGTGKTALAETIGQAVAMDGGYGVHMVKMSTQVRGTGYVGEMGSLLASSFEHVRDLCRTKGEPLIFVIDEADSLLTSRALDQHHHEDKSGVNTILQHLDRYREGPEQIAVIAITNRLGVLDPAVRRRATSSLTFGRPDEEQRRELLRRLFCTVLQNDELEALLASSGPRRVDGIGKPVPLTFSDIVHRFAVPVLRNAVQRDERLELSSLVKTMESLSPTPCIVDAVQTT